MKILISISMLFFVQYASAISCEKSFARLIDNASNEYERYALEQVRPYVGNYKLRMINVIEMSNNAHSLQDIQMIVDYIVGFVEKADVSSAATFGNAAFYFLIRKKDLPKGAKKAIKKGMRRVDRVDIRDSSRPAYEKIGRGGIVV